MKEAPAYTIASVEGSIVPEFDPQAESQMLLLGSTCNLENI